MIKIIKTIIVVLILNLTACMHNAENYQNSLLTPNRIKIKYEKVLVPLPNVHATFSLENNPNVVKAYRDFSRNYVAKNIITPGFTTIAYNAYSHPIITCAPLHLCVIQLEKNESINNISLGDSSSWLLSTALIGTNKTGSYQITLKPKRYNVATDIIISTNKRAYNIGLVSKKGSYTHILNFYYPQETLMSNLKFHDKSKQNYSHYSSVNSVIDLNNIDFNYYISGDKVNWEPQRIFNDGKHTFIQMPKIVQQIDLPLLYLWSENKLQLVNYRYKDPYYIVDNIFDKAYLIVGKGKTKQKVVIYHDK